MEEQANPASIAALCKRILRPGDLFVALQRSKFDGHDHVELAIRRGAKAVLADVGPRYGVRVFEPIPRSIRFAEAPAVGRTILATAPESPGARAYRQLAEDICGA